MQLSGKFPVATYVSWPFARRAQGTLHCAGDSQMAWPKGFDNLVPVLGVCCQQTAASC